MTRDKLIEGAEALESVSSEIVDEFAQKGEAILAEVNARMLARPDIDQLVGAENRKMMLDNHANHLRFVHAILARHDAESLVDTVLWVFRAYRNHGFRLAYWPAQLNTWTTVLGEHLSPASWERIEPLYRWFLRNQPSFTTLSDPLVGEGHPKGNTP